MLGRRTFLVTSGWILTTPALAKVRPFLTTSNPPRIPLVNPLPPQAEEAQLEGPVLQIAGWDAPVVSEKTVDSQVWISINQSWRTAWR